MNGKLTTAKRQRKQIRGSFISTSSVNRKEKPKYGFCYCWTETDGYKVRLVRTVQEACHSWIVSCLVCQPSILDTSKDNAPQPAADDTDEEQTV
ncbi:hypothetical protein PoB_001271400 [Plakobranchus ocellatus]|uniref:Uncharacterized protein n=1 Tax=Plakobranchus ocellatus TaxID=259542 RepID=A0AAV3YVY3_9GAST|nr:hypothetical protein PoB_001271400 [Plakobranchus ocellatus]